MKNSVCWECGCQSSMCKCQYKALQRYTSNFRSQCFNNGKFHVGIFEKKEKLNWLQEAGAFISFTRLKIKPLKVTSKMTTSTEIECKKICVLRCLNVLFLSCAIQFILLGIFLLFVNFNLFHPLEWLSGTSTLFFSFYTWIYTLPLISVTILYVILSSNSYLALHKYYPTRFAWLCAVGPRKLALIFIYAALGFLTAWLYSRYLSEENNTLIIECFDGYCLNSKFLFIAWSGIYSGLYYCFREKISNNKEIKFSIIKERKYVQIRSVLYKVVYSSLMNSFFPIICFTTMYWILAAYVNSYISSAAGAEDDRMLSSASSFITNIKLIFYVWILSSQILSNMYILDILFSIFLTEAIEFSIEKNPMTQSTEVTLTEGLALSTVPIVQQLASFDLYNLTNSKNTKRRQKLFALSFPGGHPYNWNQLSGQCLSLINSYTEELSESVKKISTLKCDNYNSNLKPTATDTAEKILLRQYNETYGIRRMMQSNNCPAQTIQGKSVSHSVNDALTDISKNCDEIKKATFKSVPGLFYFWGEPEGAKTAYMLSKSQNIIWIAQGLSGLCASSIVEDKYGVVQNELPNIIKSFLRLKLELDKLTNVNLNGKKEDRHFIALKNAVKRSIYKICNVFSDYIRDLIDDSDDLKNLQDLILYQDN